MNGDSDCGRQGERNDEQCRMDKHTMKENEAVPFRWVDKEDLLQRVRKGANEFMALCANLEVDHEHAPADTHIVLPAVTAMIAFEGDYRGVVWVRCGEPFAGRIAAGMLGAGQADGGENMHVALGAMINVLGGDVKLFLARGGYTVDLSLPWVSSADEAHHPHVTGGPESLLCSFLHGGERLLVGVNVRKAL